MSVDAARRALDWPGRSHVDRHVLAVIGIETNHHTDWARLTLEYLAELTGYGRATITRSLRRLAADGVLTRRGSQGRHPSEYRVNRLATGSPGEPVEVPEPARNRLATGSQPARLGEPQGDGDGDGERQTPPTPPRGELVRVDQVLPPAPVGAVGVSEPDGFRDWWAGYPRKVARGEALKSYVRAVKRDGEDLVAAGLAAWRRHWQEAGTDQQYIPHPTTFLNQARYLDAPPPRPMTKLQRELTQFLEAHQDDPH